ncbi:hypothetical protein R3W88_033143 [Solanum pinnatisectum]|uniref:Uncharacterized protein n=1 Tax=Solanum pinnatisectum TaxID=50273 RepID=A0AAV9K1U9_9SOLN|nr:hypothetical protein R3W88_033143 [Solanum pinnatisectum]
MTLQPGATLFWEGNQGKPTYATIVNQSSNSPRHPRELVIARITTHNGISAITFMENITFVSWRRNVVKICVNDNRNVFLDFTNEDDLNLIEMEGHPLWLQKWTPDFEIGIEHPYCTSLSRSDTLIDKAKNKQKEVVAIISIPARHLYLLRPLGLQVYLMSLPLLLTLQIPVLLYYHPYLWLLLPPVSLSLRHP